MAIKSKKVRLSPRERSKIRIRKRVIGSAERPRLSVFRSSMHTYAQIISDVNGRTLASASTLEGEVKSQIAAVKLDDLNSTAKSSKGIAAAVAVGLVVAQRAKAAGLASVVFDRNGYVYHGRVKAVADGARQGGLEF